MLVEFPSVVDAMRCAVEVQQAMAERNTGVGADSRIELRIGINLGDVIVEGDDLYGDGVNIAARVEALAVFARRCSRDTATLEGWITCASTPCALSHRANQKPSRPASKASAIRVIFLPALTASSRQRCSRPRSLSALGSSFLSG